MKELLGLPAAAIRGLALCLVALACALPAVGAAEQASNAEEYKLLAGAGQKVVLDADHYFVFGFDKAPKLGMAIMRLEIFSRDGKRDATFAVWGDADMPAMRGAHSTGNKQFAVSAKQIYLLPISLVMPGEWELKFTFEKNGKKVLRGAYRFKV
jgi:hypothetical protein